MKIQYLALAAASTLLPEALAQNVISRHKLNEPSGALIAKNSIPGAPDGAYLNGVAAGGCTSINGTAASFNGFDARVDFAGNTALNNLTDDFSVTGWVSRSNSSLINLENIVSNGSWSFGLQDLTGVNTPELALQVSTGGGGPISYTAQCACAPGFNTEYFVAMVIAPGGGLTFYAQAASFSGGILSVATLPGGSPGPLPIAGAIGQWTIGGSDVVLSETLQGCLSDVQIFDKALTAAQVESLFDNPGSSYGLGTTFCPAMHNSTGFRGGVDIFGSAVLAENNLTLVARDVPAGQLGYFITATNASVQLPIGNSSGILCLTGSINRLRRVPGSVHAIAVDGTFTRSLDMQDPVGIGALFDTSWAAGQSHSFQLWHRDIHPMTGAATNNFTTGTTIVLQ